MPYKAKKPCAKQGCRELTSGRFCDTHAKEHASIYDRHHRNPEAVKRYKGAWVKIRGAFLASNPLCAICEAEGRLTPATIAHHIKAVDDGGTNDWTNLQALCSPCHSRLHGKQGDYF